jgi:tetratricopeptide (TPR) repeat protein
VDDDDRKVEALLEQAVRYRRAGNLSGALDMQRRALAIAPDHARAHAELALTLLAMRRLAGAAVEVGLALANDANDAHCHYAAAAVRRAERALDDAWRHCEVALQAEPHDVDIRVLAASIHALRGDRVAARAQLDEALALAPESPSVLGELARLALHDGEVDEASRWIERALRAEPTRSESHLIAGYIALRRGDAATAEQHARTALSANASDQDALRLWSAIKAHRSVVLGAWWRFNALVSLRSERGQLGILIGSFVVVRVIILVLRGLGWEDAAHYLHLAWLGLCAYTWVAPELFRRAVQRDLAGVVLRDDY